MLQTRARCIGADGKVRDKVRTFTPSPRDLKAGGQESEGFVGGSPPGLHFKRAIGSIEYRLHVLLDPICPDCGRLLGNASLTAGTIADIGRMHHKPVHSIADWLTARETEKRSHMV